jgi:CBS domain-containing protein
MITHLIRKEIPVLSPDDDLSDAEALVLDEGFKGLPVVAEGKLSGVIFESELEIYAAALATQPSKKIAALMLLQPLTLEPSSHLYDAVKIFNDTAETTRQRFIPVADKSLNYIGAVLKEDMVVELSKILSVGEQGIVLELEVPATAYRIADLVSTVEQNDAHILSLATRLDERHEKRLVTLQVETTESFRLQRSLERHGYTITYSTPTSSSLLDDTQHRANEFLRYLET